MRKRSEKMPMLVDLKNMPSQICFLADGYMFCNYIIKKGRALVSQKGWIRFIPTQAEKKELLPETDKSSRQLEKDN